jgi:hypothetical protein
MLDGSILTVEQLGMLLHKSPASIRSDASRSPTSLPPLCRLPGTKRLLWRQQDVSEWLERFVQRDPIAHPVAVPLLGDIPAKRGRPRKTEVRS